ncbi:porin family protein [Vibrio gallicus]|uniref:porin family protein n=1 Tax=Vibrio gallicus TaxID=190897 RepID=UPI0021C3B37F|nr:porin family protein [Vibrio gallicus]
MNNKILSLAICLTAFSTSTLADVYITPMVGYGMGGSFEDANEDSFDIDHAMNLNLAIETKVDQGRLGLLYSQQDSEISDLKLDTTMRYLHFQSAVYYPFHDKWNSYLGLSLGGTQIDIQGADTDYKFSAGFYGGVEYRFTRNFAFQTQLRYLGTLVDGNSVTYCKSDSTQQSCKFAYKGDWLSQFQANVGLTFNF